MSIEKITIQQTLKITEYSKFYSRTASAEKDSVINNSHETAETFDIDQQIKDRFIDISDKAIERNKRLKLPSPEMERIINRIKTSQLSYKRKELLLRQVWAKVRTESLSQAEGSAQASLKSSGNSRHNRDFEESFTEMIRTFESVEKKKLSFNDLSKHMRKIDDLVEKLISEDDQFGQQKIELEKLVEKVRTYENIAQELVAKDWEPSSDIEVEN